MFLLVISNKTSETEAKILMKVPAGPRSLVDKRVDS